MKAGTFRAFSEDLELQVVFCHRLVDSGVYLGA